MANICVVGSAGYVGLTYSVAFAIRGHQVVGLDIDATKVDGLSHGRSPIFEPGIDELLRLELDSGRLRFSSDYADAIPGARFVFVCVGTPADPTGRAETGFVMAAARAIAQHAEQETIVVTKSTLPVGSVQRVEEVLAEHGRPGVTFSVVANPEFLREGSALHDVLQPDRIVLGADDLRAAQEVAALYEGLEAPVVLTDPRSAEMIKYASNAFLATKISFVNEVAEICERLGADVTVVARGMGLDDRIGPRFLGAGAGFGGSCFPKDVRALASLARDHAVDPSMLTAVLAINDGARRRIVAKLLDRLGGARGKRVAVLGLAFKPETDDIRDAPSLDVIAELTRAGVTVRAADPVVGPRASGVLADIEVVADPYVAATGADAVVLMTEWEAYRSLNFERLANAMRGRYFLDARNALDAGELARAGLRYDGIGRGRWSRPAAPAIAVAATHVASAAD